MTKMLSLLMRLAVVATVTLSMSLFAVIPAQADPAGNPYALQHLFDCMGMAFTDPAKHLAECGQGTEATGPFYHSPNSNIVTPPSCPTAFDQARHAPSIVLVNSPCCLPGSFDLHGSGDPMIVQVGSCCPISYEGQGSDGNPSVIPVTCCGVSYRGDVSNEPMIIPVCN